MLGIPGGHQDSIHVYFLIRPQPTCSPISYLTDEAKCRLTRPYILAGYSFELAVYTTPIGLKAHCHPRISFGLTKFISQFHSKNVGTSVKVSFHLTGF